VRCDGDIGVDVDEDVAGGRARETLAGPRLPEPALRQRAVAAGDEADPGVALRVGADDVGRGVARAVVEHEDLEVVDAVRGEQGGQAGADPQLLVARRHEDADPLGDGRRGVGRGAQEAQVVRRVHGGRARGERARGDDRLGAARQSRPVHSA
jgi:hypothetical protein